MGSWVWSSTISFKIFWRHFNPTRLNNGLANVLVKLFEEKYNDNDIPRPSFWGGFGLKPEEFEFWEDGDFRLHDRFILKPTNVKNEWIAKRHYP